MASLASIHHHGWCTQAAWTKEVSENNGQLCIHGSRLDQNTTHFVTLNPLQVVLTMRPCIEFTHIIGNLHFLVQTDCAPLMVAFKV